jgi:N-acetylglutamate synthase-like GNAT family acetyltransferase
VRNVVIRRLDGRLAALLRAENLPLAGAEEYLANFMVATNDNKLVGVAGLEIYGRVALLRSVVVNTSMHGTGLGLLLTRQALKLA